jgi:hypothetical protein
LPVFCRKNQGDVYEFDVLCVLHDACRKVPVFCRKTGFAVAPRFTAAGVSPENALRSRVVRCLPESASVLPEKSDCSLGIRPRSRAAQCVPESAGVLPVFAKPALERSSRPVPSAQM